MIIHTYIAAFAVDVVVIASQVYKQHFDSIYKTQTFYLSQRDAQHLMQK